MNEINKAKRLRVAAEDEGEAVKIRAVKEAEAEASRTEIQAKADAEAKFLGGQGIARQRQAIMEGLRESVNAFKSGVVGVDAKAVMDLMIVTQYFDMMKDIGAQSKTNAVFMNHSPVSAFRLLVSFIGDDPFATFVCRVLLKIWRSLYKKDSYLASLLLQALPSPPSPTQ